MPVHSSEVNPVETVWSMLKRSFYEEFFRRQINIADTAAFELVLAAFITKFKPQINEFTVLKSGSHFVRRYLGEA